MHRSRIHHAWTIKPGKRRSHLLKTFFKQPLMSKYTISVIIPTSDRPQYLRQAIDSVLSQTPAPFEIIVLDNGQEPVDPAMLPTSSIVHVIRALPRFGVAQARNLGVILSQGDYVAFLDDDDAWSQDYLSSVLQAIDYSDADLLLGQLRNMETGEPLPGKQGEFTDRADLVRQILVRNPGAVGSNTVIKREVFISSKGYDPWLVTGEDKSVVLDLLISGALPQPAPGAWVDFRNDGVGPRQNEHSNLLKGRWRFLNKYWQHMTPYHRFLNVAQIIRLYAISWLRRAG